MKTISENQYLIPKDVLLNYAVKEYLKDPKSNKKMLRKVSLIRRIWNERKIKRLSDKLINELNPYFNKLKEGFNYNTDLSSSVIERIKLIVTDYILELDKRKLFFDRPFLSFFIEQGYLRVAEEFIIRAKKEESKLKSEEIFQALRNVWIMNSLQIFWGLPLEMTPSVYAYSMLYPYTDNFLDNPGIDNGLKVEFNNRLSQVLKGEKLIPNNHIEEKVFSLVSQIESQYCRDIYPEVFDSINLIQDAQSESMRQDKDEILSYDEILPISFFKGGTSVLADAYLIKGNLSIDEMHFAFNYGTFLQILDDLQDAVSDKEDNHQTLFSIKKDNELIDNEIKRLISYILKINSEEEFDTENMSLMKSVISSCTLVMVMEAVGRNPELISSKLYNELESYSKVRLTFYKEFEEKIRILLNDLDLN